VAQCRIGVLSSSMAAPFVHLTYATLGNEVLTKKKNIFNLKQSTHSFTKLLGHCCVIFLAHSRSPLLCILQCSLHTNATFPASMLLDVSIHTKINSDICNNDPGDGGFKENKKRKIRALTK